MPTREFGGEVGGVAQVGFQELPVFGRLVLFAVRVIGCHFLLHTCPYGLPVDTDDGTGRSTSLKM